MTSNTSARKRKSSARNNPIQERRMTVPEVRERLHEIADETGNAELHDLANHLIRRFFGRVPKVSLTVTPAIVSQVRTLHRQQPKMAYHQIGEIVGISSGRVSEILHGKRS